MDIQSKLRLIQEGYTISDINTGHITLPKDDFSLLFSSLFIDLEYISEMSNSLLQESDVPVNRPNKDLIFRRILDMIVQKIGQFKMLLMNLFRKKKQELTYTHLAKLQSLLGKNFTPFVFYDTFEDVVYSPKDAIKNLKDVMERFEDSLVRRFDAVYNGDTAEMTRYQSISDLRKVTWGQVIIGRNITSDNNITKSAIDITLKRVPSVEINSSYQVQNIVEFAGNFYDLWKDINESLSYYEGQLKKLRSLSDESFRSIRLVCETILYTLPEILKYVDSHLGRLVTLDRNMT
jgi:hypothetical protein